MKISVKFLDKFNNSEDSEFTYKGYENVEVGDIVVAETRYGYALAVVSAVDVKDNQFNESNLKGVVTIVKSMATIRQEQERMEQIKNLANQVKRANAVANIRALANGDEGVMTFVDTMSDAELGQFITLLSK